MAYEVQTVRKVVAVCDECEAAATTDHENATSAKAELKEEGWAIGQQGKALCVEHSNTKIARDIRTRERFLRWVREPAMQTQGWRNW